MRFTAHGPSIPDELLHARDRNEVVFFCGAGVSQARAELSNFAQLARKVMDQLGPVKGSPARKLLDVATTMDPIEGVGGFVATDRVFSLLEREFDTTDIHAAVAGALKPKDHADLSAHGIVLDLAGRRSGSIRLVTTNFDRLFEECSSEVGSIGPAHLPDPKRAELNAVIHLHGRVDPYYLGSDDEGFVLSSGDFGRAYLADGWAARFIQSLLARFSIVFLGYSADDPPVQYLLEALKGASQAHGRMYAFQSGESAVATSLWENKGVHAMSYDPSNRHEALWSTLEAWVQRVNDIDGWHDRVLKNAARGPEVLLPHERGQVAHVLSYVDGIRRLTQTADGSIPASWLRVIDSNERYGHLDMDADRSRKRLDPFDRLGLDDDTPPPPPNPGEDESDYTSRPREVPKDSWDGLQLCATDASVQDRRSDVFRGRGAATAGSLPPRLELLAIWLMKVADQPEAFSWAMKQADLHPQVKNLVSWELRYRSDRFPAEIARGWQYLLRVWDDHREEPNEAAYAVSVEVKAFGWSHEMVRRLIGTRRPRLKVEAPFMIPGDGQIFRLKIDYPRPDIEVEIPPEMLGSAVARLRENLEYACSLEAEVRRSDQIYLPTTYEREGELLGPHAHGLVGLVLEAQRVMGRLADIDPAAAHAEFLRWSIDDDGIFARLRIWAAGQPRITTADEAAAVLFGLSDKAFWGSLHQRDLMMSLGSRWNDFSQTARLQLERKLTSTTYPWDDRSKSEKYNDRTLIERLRWLAAHQAQFSFDVDRVISNISTRLESDLDDTGQFVGDAQPDVFSVGTEDDPDDLSSKSIPDILSAAVEGDDFRAYAQHDRFSRLVEKHPIKALAALSNEAKNGRIHAKAWGSFLRSEKRELDSTRLLHLICGRLAGMTAEELAEILYPATEWTRRVSKRLVSELPDKFETLWHKMVEAAAALPAEDGERYSERNWAEDGLNRPVGKLTQILIQDPSLSGKRRNSGLDPRWKARMETLLALQGDLRRQALVFASFQFVFFWLIDPKWAEVMIMPSMETEGPDGDAFWDGFLWANKVPPLALLKKMRASIVRRVAEGSQRKRATDSLADIVLYAWIKWSDRKRPSFSNAQFRETIVEGGAEFGKQVLWGLGRQLQRSAVSRDKVILFFREVWPLQKAMKSAEISRSLVAFLFKSGNLFPEVSRLIVGRLIPCENFDTYTLHSEKEGGIIETYPEDLLEILLRLLPNDVSRWPHYTGEILDRLARAPHVNADARLVRLRRMMGRPAVRPAS